MNRRSQTIGTAAMALAVVGHLTFLLTVSGKAGPIDDGKGYHAADFLQYVAYLGGLAGFFLGALTLAKDATPEARRRGELALAIAMASLLTIFVVGFEPDAKEDTPAPPGVSAPSRASK